MLALATLKAQALAADPTQRTVQASGPSGAHEGTLLRPAPAKAAPLVIIIPGSGMLADGPAAREIATLRIDKRGLYGSKPATPDPHAVNAQDYATDIHALLAIAHTLSPAPAPGCSSIARAARSWTRRSTPSMRWNTAGT